MFLFFCLCLFTLVSAQAQEIRHTLSAGETLFALSRRYGVSLDDLKAANNIADERRLRVGQVLVIPQFRQHKVAAGETLYRLALGYGVPVETLQQLNGLARPQDLRVGQILRVPGAPDRAPAVSPGQSPNPGPATVAVPPTAPPGAQPPANPAGTTTAPAARPGSNQTPSGLAYPQPVTGTRPEVQSQPWPSLLYPALNAEVRSVSAGRVLYVGPYRGVGQLILVEEEGGRVHGYALYDRALIHQGQVVGLGEPLAMTGERSGLLYFLFQDGRPVHPGAFGRN